MARLSGSADGDDSRAGALRPDEPFGCVLEGAQCLCRRAARSVGQGVYGGRVLGQGGDAAERPVRFWWGYRAGDATEEVVRGHIPEREAGEEKEEGEDREGSDGVDICGKAAEENRAQVRRQRSSARR